MDFVKQAKQRGYDIKMIDHLTCELYLPTNGKLVARVAIQTMEVGSQDSLDAWFNHFPSKEKISSIYYHIVRDTIPDTRLWTDSQYLLLAQVLLPGQHWQDFIHPRRGGAAYDISAEHMIHLDVHEVYPNAMLREYSKEQEREREL